MKRFTSLKVVLATLLLLYSAAIATRQTGSHGVSLDPPAGWLIQAAPQTALVLMAPEPLETFHPNINVLVQQTGSTTYDQYHTITVESASNFNGTTSGYAPFTFNNGKTGRSLILNFQSEGQNFTSLSIWLTENGTTYLVTGTTTAEDYPNKEAFFYETAKTLLINRDKLGG